MTWLDLHCIMCENKRKLIRSHTARQVQKTALKIHVDNQIYIYTFHFYLLLTLSKTMKMYLKHQDITIKVKINMIMKHTYFSSRLPHISIRDMTLKDLMINHAYV